MADLTTQLTGALNQKLQIVIVPYNQTYEAPEDKTGLIIFREGAGEDKGVTIEVNGHKYGADNDTNFDNLGESLSTLKKAGLLTESGGVYTVKDLTVTDTGITLPAAQEGQEAPTSGTIADFLKQLEAEITLINTHIPHDLDAEVASSTITLTGATGSQTAALTTGLTGPQVGVFVKEVDGKVTNVEVLTQDIASATGVAGALAELDANNTLHLYSGAEGTAAATHVRADGSTYRLVQGEGTSASTVATFNIEKDSFLKSGQLIYTIATPAGTATAPVATVAAGTTGANPYLELCVYVKTAGDPDSEEAENYIYIPADSLVDVYTAADNQTGPITVSIDDHTISASLAIDSHTETGAASGTAAVSATSASDIIQVVGAVAVTTVNGGVTGVDVTSISVDKAGAAAKAKEYAEQAAATGAFNTSLAAATGAAAYSLAEHAAATGAAAVQLAEAAATAAASAAAAAALHTTVESTPTGSVAGNGYISVTNTAGSGEAANYVVDTTTALDDAIAGAQSAAIAHADSICSWTIIGAATGAQG